MSTIFVVKKVLSSGEVKALQQECNGAFDNNADASELGAAVDLFEDSVITENSLVRSDRQEFLAERWKRSKDRGESTEKLIEAIIFKKLAHLVANCFTPYSDAVFLFNEHYVVKDVGTEISFRWHCDANEQLLAVQHSDRPDYVSLWCPLDDVSADNGTIAFPPACEIVTVGKLVSFAS